MRLSLIAALAWAVAGVAGAAPVSPADETALRALGEAADTAWNAKDARQMGGYYAEDATLLVGGVMLPEQVGRAQIESYFQKAFAGRIGDLRHVSEIRNLEMVGPDLAFTDVLVRVESRRSDGTWQVVRRFNNVSLSERSGTVWRLKVVRAFPIEG
jgi:uncharacterized protein (TIGR02246 family)